MFVIVLLAIGGGGSYVYWLWTRSDELLRQEVLAKLNELAPHWVVDIGRARFDWIRKVHLYDVALRSKADGAPIVTLSEVVLTVDRSEFTQHQNVLIHRIRLVRPTVELERDADGNWNWSELLPLPRSDRLSPEWEIEQAQALLRFQQPEGGPALLVAVDDANVQLVPSGKRQYVVKGSAHVSRVGSVNLDGHWSIDEGSWSLNGDLPELTISNDLLAVADGVSDQARLQRQRLEEALEKLARGTEPDGTPRANDRDVSTAGLGVAGTLDAHFSLSRWKPDAEMEFKVLLNLQQGHISHAALPFPLYDVKGVFYVDNHEYRLRNLSARNGTARLLLNLRAGRAPGTPATVEIEASDLALDERLKEHLPASVRKLYDSLHPTGQIDVKGLLRRDDHARWIPEGFVLTARQGTCAYEKFPYPVADVSGTLTQLKNSTDLRLDFQGLAGRRPVRVVGTVTNPGLEAQAVLDVRVDKLPVNDVLIAACPPFAQKTFDVLKLKGTADALCRLHRPPGPNQKFRWQLACNVFGGSLECQHFPYRVADLSGQIETDSATGEWVFKNVHGVHGEAELDVEEGRFVRGDDGQPGWLRFRLTARNAEVDKDLERALPPRLQKLWQEISPTGQMNLIADVSWIPGQPFEVALPEVQVSEGSFVLKAFPYPLENVQAAFTYGKDAADPSKDRIEIRSLTARHDDTKVRSKGFVLASRAEDATADWTVRLTDLHVDDLSPDRLFRRALPADLRGVADVLNPQGKLSLSGMIEFRGTTRDDDPVTSAWDLTAVLSQSVLSAGIELRNVNGEARVRGIWNGSRAEMEGQLDLNSVEVWGHQLTQVQGPFHLKDRYLVVGSPKAFPEVPQGAPPSIPDSEHITAHAFDATFTLDAEALLNEQTEYHVKVAMKDGNLRKYAERYLSNAHNLRGTMYGWIDLRGSGPDAANVKGAGQLLISPAALYELPIIVQIFKAFSFVPPDKTAFIYALTSFNVADSQFEFREIDLIGDAISLRGQGTARFDGKLHLDFFSMMSRNQLNVPFLKEYIVDPLTRGWVKVEVRGQVQNPIATYRAAPQLDAALERFLSAFNPRAMRAAPRLVIPWFAAPPLAPAPVPSPSPRPQVSRSPK